MWALIPGVPIGCRSPRKRGPYSTPIHNRIRDFYHFYRDGRADRTAALALRGIADLVKATHPPDGLPWLNKASYRLSNAAKPAKSKIGKMATVAELLAVADHLMEQGRLDLDRGHRSGAQCFRDGLMIATLAHRPLRRRNLTALRIGESFLVDGDRVRVRFNGSQTKTRQPIEFDCPTSLSGPFTFYLSTVRPVLRERAVEPDDRFLWVGRSGSAMGAAAVAQRISSLTKRYLGRMISPHLFRDCVATDIAIHDPTHVGITKSVLGHSTLATSQQYYNSAGSFVAADRLGQIVDTLRGPARDELRAANERSSPERDHAAPNRSRNEAKR